MKNQMVKAVMAMALLAGCGGSGLWPVGSGAPPTGTSTSQPLQVDVRMRAVGTQGFASLQLLADEVRVRADGQPVPVTLTGAPMELTDENQAYKLATVQVPRGTKELSFEVRLAPAGVFDQGHGLGWIDASSTVLRFTSSLENVSEKNKADLVIDAAKTFVQRDADTVQVVPHFAVAY